MWRKSSRLNWKLALPDCWNSACNEIAESFITIVIIVTVVVIIITIMTISIIMHVTVVLLRQSVNAICIAGDKP